MERLAEHRQQYLVVDVVEAPFDVALDEPADTVQWLVTLLKAVWQPRSGRKPWERSENCGS